MLAVLEIISSGINLKIALIDKGKSSFQRRCTANTKSGCKKCPSCDVINGFGGAGMFSDGKLHRIDTDRKSPSGTLLKSIYDHLERFGLKKFDQERPYLRQLKLAEKELRKVGLDFSGYVSQHVGTRQIMRVTRNVERFLVSKGVKIHYKSRVVEVIERKKHEGYRYIVKCVDEEGNQTRCGCQYLVIGIGKAGYKDFTRMFRHFSFRFTANRPTLGIRYEFPTAALESITNDIIKDPLISYQANSKDTVMTFCSCSKGTVVPYYTGEVLLLGGQSSINAETRLSNFAILNRVNLSMKRPMDYLYNYATQVVSISENMPLIQTYRDLTGNRMKDTHKRHSTTLKFYRYHNLNLVLPRAVIENVIEFLTVLSKVDRRFVKGDNVISAPVFELSIPRIALTDSYESDYENLYIVGDISGCMTGMMPSAMMGAVAARSILNKSKR